MGYLGPVPIILRSVDLGKTPFNKLQSLPRNGKPVNEAINIDKTWTEVAKEIRALCNRLRTTQKKQ